MCHKTMLVKSVPELVIQPSSEVKTVSLIIKCIGFVTLVICLIAVSVLFVKISFMPVEPYRSPFLSKAISIQGKEQNNNDDQENIYVNIQLEPQADYPKLDLVIDEIPVALNDKIDHKVLNSQESNLERPGTMTVLMTFIPILSSFLDDETILKAQDNEEKDAGVISTDKSDFIDGSSTTNQCPLREWLPSLKSKEDKESEINNEGKDNSHPFLFFFGTPIGPNSDSKETSSESDEAFRGMDILLDFPSSGPSVDSREKNKERIEEEKFSDFVTTMKAFFNEPKEKTLKKNDNSNEALKSTTIEKGTSQDSDEKERKTEVM